MVEVGVVYIHHNVSHKHISVKTWLNASEGTFLVLKAKQKKRKNPGLTLSNDFVSNKNNSNFKFKRKIDNEFEIDSRKYIDLH